MTKRARELKKLAIKADENEIRALLSILKKAGMKEVEINDIKKSYSFKNKVMSIPNESISQNITNSLYSDEINKIKYIASNNELINKIGGLKVLFFGRTGTGKTTVIKEIISEIIMKNNFEFKQISFERMISHKMGQSQINFLNLSEEISMASQKKGQIIFIDELDSIISNRITSNDIGEHHRIVATFIKFLDNLPKNVIVFSATNISMKIDQAILRRFSLKVKGKLINYNSFIKILNNNFNISPIKFNKFIDMKNINYEFTVSDINHYINSLRLKEAMEKKEIDPFVFFVSLFKEKIQLNHEKLSERTKTSLKKVGLNE